MDKNYKSGPELRKHIREILLKFRNNDKLIAQEIINEKMTNYFMELHKQVKMEQYTIFPVDYSACNLIMYNLDFDCFLDIKK